MQGGGWHGEQGYAGCGIADEIDGTGLPSPLRTQGDVRQTS